jgi:hypothetical protein
LWAEMKKVSERRNAIVHRGEDVDAAAAKVAIAVAGTLLSELRPTVFAEIGLKLVQGNVVTA